MSDDAGSRAGDDFVPSGANEGKCAGDLALVLVSYGERWGGTIALSLLFSAVALVFARWLLSCVSAYPKKKRRKTNLPFELMPYVWLLFHSCSG